MQMNLENFSRCKAILYTNKANTHKAVWYVFHKNRESSILSYKAPW